LFEPKLNQSVNASGAYMENILHSESHLHMCKNNQLIVMINRLIIHYKLQTMKNKIPAVM